MTNPMDDLETTLFTSMSVAIQTMEAMIEMLPPSPQQGYLKGMSSSIRTELDGFLDDRDRERLGRAAALVDEANVWLKKAR